MQTCPGPHGAQGRPGQTPAAEHLPPFGQPHLPPQPSVPPQLPSFGHFGVQHAPCEQRESPGQPHVSPHPSELPHDPSIGQLGVQHWPE